MSTTRTRAARASSLATTSNDGLDSFSPTHGEKKLLAVPVLALALLLAGCGGANTGGANTAEPSTAAPSTSTAAPTSSPPATATATPGPSSGDTAWIASGPSFGVDRAEWPRKIKDVRTLLTSLPKELSGEARELQVDPRVEGSAGASYGKVGTVEVTSEEHQEGAEKLSALQLLQAGFGLGAVCAEETYKGTAPVPVFAEGAEEAALSKPGPGVTEGSQPAWFSCKPLTERDEWGYAVGWTSGKTAWRLFARDEKAARTLVTALHGAAR